MDVGYNAKEYSWAAGGRIKEARRIEGCWVSSDDDETERGRGEGGEAATQEGRLMIRAKGFALSNPSPFPSSVLAPALNTPVGLDMFHRRLKHGTLMSKAIFHATRHCSFWVSLSSLISSHLSSLISSLISHLFILSRSPSHPSTSVSLQPQRSILPLLLVISSLDPSLGTISD